MGATVSEIAGGGGGGEPGTKGLGKGRVNRLQTYKELNYYNDYILSRGCPHKP